MVVVRSVNVWTFTEDRQRLRELIQQRLDAVHHGDYVGPGLALDIHNNRGRVVHPGGLPDVLDVVLNRGYIRHLHRRAVPVSDDERPVVGARKQLVIGAYLIVLVGTIKTTFGLIDIGGYDGTPQVLQVNSERGQPGRISSNPDGGFLPATDAYQAHSRQLRNLRRQARVGQVLNFR